MTNNFDPWTADDGSSGGGGNWYTGGPIDTITITGGQSGNGLNPGGSNGNFTIGDNSSGGGDGGGNSGFNPVNGQTLPTRKPDLTTLQSTQAWIARNLPTALANKINDKLATVWRDATHPEYLLKDVINEVTGINVDTGEFRPGNLISTLGTAGLGGIIVGVVGGINSLFKLITGDTPSVSLEKVVGDLGLKPKDGEGINGFTDPDPNDFVPNQGDPKVGGPVTDLGDANGHGGSPGGYTVVPNINADGTIAEIVIGSNSGGPNAVISPNDFGRYGIDPNNIYNFDYSSLITGSNSGTGGEPQTGAPPKLGPGQSIGPDGKVIDTVTVNGKKPDDTFHPPIMTDSSGVPTLNPDGSVNTSGVTPGEIEIGGGKPPKLTPPPVMQIGGDDTMRPGSGSGTITQDPAGGPPIVHETVVPTITVTPKPTFTPGGHMPGFSYGDPGETGTNPGSPDPTPKPGPKPEPTPTPTPIPTNPDPDPTDPNPGTGPTPSPTPSPGPAPAPFAYFAMPEFKILPNDFGKSSVDYSKIKDPDALSKIKGS